MSELLFKRLFEINLLHDYYLVSADGDSFFEKPKAIKEAIIKNKLYHQMYDVADFLEIEPSEATKNHLREFKLIYKKTSLGFVIGIQVQEEFKSEAKVYKPRFKLPDNLSLTFSVKVIEPYFLSMTNISMRSALPTIYYFTNKAKKEFIEEEPNYKTLPLTVEAEKHQAGMHHEMGTLVKFGTELREALEFTDVSSSNLNLWEKVSDKRYVTNADRVLLPAIFNYPIKKEQDITQLQVELEDQNANLIKSISKTSVNPLQNVLLNFEMVDETIENPIAISEGFYKLRIRQNGGPEIIYPVHLNDSLYNKNHLGIIDIRLDEIDPPFSLLDTEGHLITRINKEGKFLPHPVFELRFKNRRTYWRYRKDPNFSSDAIITTNDLGPYVEYDSITKKIISKKPKGLTRTLVPFKNGTNEKTLPHPKTPSFRVEGKRMFSEIYINKSNRLVE